jgi:hypothetical protein
MNQLETCQCAHARGGRAREREREREKAVDKTLSLLLARSRGHAACRRAHDSDVVPDRRGTHSARRPMRVLSYDSIANADMMLSYAKKLGKMIVGERHLASC